MFKTTTLIMIFSGLTFVAMIILFLTSGKKNQKRSHQNNNANPNSDLSSTQKIILKITFYIILIYC